LQRKKNQEKASPAAGGAGAEQGGAAEGMASEEVATEHPVLVTDYKEFTFDTVASTSNQRSSLLFDTRLRWILEVAAAQTTNIAVREKSERLSACQSWFKSR